MADFRLSKAGKKKEPQQALPPVESASLLSKAGGAAASGLHTLGSILSTPARIANGSVNYALGLPGGAGSWHPLDSTGGIEGGDLLTNLGVLPKNDSTKWELSDIGRFAGSVLLDPLNLVPAGGLAKAGSAAFKAVPGASKVAKAVKQSAPIRLTRAVMDATVKGKTHAAIQRHAGAVEASRVAAQRGIDQDTLAFALRHHKQGFADPIHSEVLRDIVEGLPNPSATAEHHALASEMSRAKDAMHAQDKFMGVRTGDLDDTIQHFPRFLSKGVELPANDFGGGSGFKVKSPMRDDVYKGISTNDINRLVTDQHASAAIEGAQAAGLPFGDQVNAAVHSLSSNPRFGHLPSEQLGDLASKMVGVPALRKEGLFRNSPLSDSHSYLSSGVRRQHNAQLVVRSIADEMHPSTHGTPIAQFFENAGFEPQIAAQRVADITGTTAQDVLTKSIPDDLASELKSLTPGYRAPPAESKVLDAIKSIGGVWKANVLSMPASRTRDFTSAIVQSALSGHGGLPFSKGWNDARNIAHAAPLAGDYSHLKEVSDLAARHNLSPQEAVRVVLGAEAPRGSGIAGDVAPGQIGSTVEDIVDQIPGTRPSGVREVFGRALKNLRHGELDRSGNPMATNSHPLNPFGIANTFGQESTGFGPVAASNALAHAGDEFTRHANLLSQFARGVEPKLAGEKMRSALIDYSGDRFSRFEKDVLGNLVPFYKFAKGSTAHLAKDLAERPSGLQGQLIRELDRQQARDPSLPDSVLESTAIPLGQGEDGSKSYLSGLGLMGEQPTRIIGNAINAVTGNPKALGYDALGMLSPYLRGPLEQTTGQSLYMRGEPLSNLDKNTARTASNLLEMTGMRSPEDKPLDYPGSSAVETAIGMSPFTRLATTARQLTDTRKGAAEKAINLLTGLRTQNVSAEKQQRTLIKRVLELSKEEGARTLDDVYFKGDLSPRQAELKKLLHGLRAHASASRKKKSKGQIRLAKSQ